MSSILYVKENMTQSVYLGNFNLKKTYCSFLLHDKKLHVSIFCFQSIQRHLTFLVISDTVCLPLLYRHQFAAHH